MPNTTTLKHPTRRDIGLTLLLYAAIMAASLGLAALRPASTASVLGSAAAAAGGTLAMALYLARWTPYPRWGFLGAAGVMAAGILGSTLLVPDAAAWTSEVKPMLWMHPWFFMVMAWIPPGARSGWCAAEAPWSGWLLVGAGALLSALLWTTLLLARVM